MAMSDHAQATEKDRLTLGQAIDQIISALENFEPNDQQTILRAVYAHLKISGPSERAPGDGTALEQERAGAKQQRSDTKKPGGGEYDGMDIRTFKEAKNPTSARQMACIVAFYLNEIAPADERKNVVTTADLERYFKQAKYPLPGKLEQLLIDCKSSGYFEVVDRGEYKLTRVGHNLVEHQMPQRGKG